MSENIVTEKNYCNVVKKVKKDNITKDNISEIMLCQVPGVSSQTAHAIFDKFKNINNLLKSIEMIAYDLGMTEIMIDMDASSLYISCNNKNYDFSLKNLYLFTSGNTWYGKYGFNLKYKPDKFLHIVNEFINQPFIDIKKNTFQNFFKPKKQIRIKDYFKNMLDDIQRLTHNKTCINIADDAILENYHRILQHYTSLFDKINNVSF
jgi:5'-3' exonuclease